jgi:hypothetical protein
VARREFDIVAAWSVCRLERSLSYLIGLFEELQAPLFNPMPHAIYLTACTHDRLDARKPLLQPDQQVRNLDARARPNVATGIDLQEH